MNHIPSCSCKRMVSGDLVRLSSATTRSNIGLVVIYRATLMWRWEIYPPIGYIPAYDSTSTVREYPQSTIRHQCIQPEIHCANQLWRFPSHQIMSVYSWNYFCDIIRHLVSYLFIQITLLFGMLQYYGLWCYNPNKFIRLCQFILGIIFVILLGI